jgi:two-component system KDP operon response regulator KdpE
MQKSQSNRFERQRMTGIHHQGTQSRVHVQLPAADLRGGGMIDKARVLLVDDDQAIHRLLVPTLEANGYKVTPTCTGAEAIRRVASEAPDAVILEVDLADMDGHEVIAKMRAYSAAPLIVLSARDHEAEKIAAFDLGIDDYVNKPFSVGELMARLRIALRRHTNLPNEVHNIEAGDLSINLRAHSVDLAGRDLKLTPREFDLLTLLARNAGRVLTHRQILNAIWGPAHLHDRQYLRVYIGQLRHKLRYDLNEPHLIWTEPGIGYCLREEPQRVVLDNVVDKSMRRAGRGASVAGAIVP